MKKYKIVTLVAVVLTLITVFACCGKTPELNLSPEAAKAYIYLFDREKISYADEAFAALTDINGDGKEEMILEVYRQYVAVYGYDYTENEVVELQKKNLGKGYTMQGYYDTEKHQVIFPSASTKAGRTYLVYEFSGNEATQVKSVKRTSEGIGSNIVAVYKIDDVVCTKEEYEAAEASLAEGFTAIDTPAAEIIEKLRAVAADEN